MTKELTVLKQMFGNLSEQDKQSFMDYLFKSNAVKEVVKPREVKGCPHCGSAHFVKNGSGDGKQRYLCRDCEKSFVQETGTIFKSTKKDLAVWKKYIHCMVQKYPLRRCAKKCGITLYTEFTWRHKILDALQNMMDDVTLNGVVEADETFTNVSYKGNHKSFNLPRKSFKRGGKASKRGLSKEKVCIPCGINLNGLSIARISNLGKPKWTDIEKVLGGRVEENSVFVTDSFRGYKKLSYTMSLNHIQIPRNKHKNGVFNIQLLNNYHAHLKVMINIRFKGVATKYLNSYLVYHNFVNFAKEREAEKEGILFNFVQNTMCESKTFDIAKRQAIPM